MLDCCSYNGYHNDGDGEDKRKNENILVYPLSTKEVSTEKLEFKGTCAFRSNWNFEVLVFCGGRKIGETGKKPADQGQEPTTNSIHIWRQLRDSNLGRTGGR